MINKPSDQLDQASDLAQKINDSALEAHLKAARKNEPTISAKFCHECDGEIPEKRRLLIKTNYCVDCASILGK